MRGSRPVPCSRRAGRSVGRGSQGQLCRRLGGTEQSLRSQAIRSDDISSSVARGPGHSPADKAPPSSRPRPASPLLLCCPAGVPRPTLLLCPRCTRRRPRACSGRSPPLPAIPARPRFSRVNTVQHARSTLRFSDSHARAPAAGGHTRPGRWSSAGRITFLSHDATVESSSCSTPANPVEHGVDRPVSAG